MTDLPLASNSPASTIPTNPVMEDELARVNREIYERNVELAIRNRTLSILGKIYEIINTSLGLKETAFKLIEAVVQELKFQKGFIALVDKETKELRTIAVSDLRPEQDELLVKYRQPFKKFSVPLSNENNFCVASVLHNQRRMTNILSDILTPMLTEDEANEVAKSLNIQTSVLYPIVFAGRPFGVLYLGLDKHVGDLSRVERETLKELIEVVAIAVERAQIYADLRVANEQLKELDRLKDEFVYVASHELRTPMTAIKNYLWLTLNRDEYRIDDKARRNVERAYLSSERLIKLVQDMLTVSRIEGNRVVLTFETLDLYPQCQQVYETLKINSDQKNIKLSISPPEGTYMVRADRTRIMEIAENLLGNAIKFTPVGGSIAMTIARKGDVVETRVTDTGPGISKDGMSKLFQKFARLEHSYAKMAESSGGTGLGLYIAKQIVEMHKGKIWVESEEGKGSTFIFSLPAVATQPPTS